MTLTLRRQPDTSADDEFWYVHDEADRVVGRVFRSVRSTHAGPESWFWGIAHPYESGSTEPHYGHAPSRGAAMAAFKKRWLLSQS